MAGSSMGRFSRSGGFLPLSLMFSTASSRMESVWSPRKSIFTRPSFSTGSIVNWVTVWVTSSSPSGADGAVDLMRRMGTRSVMGTGVMTTPAACWEAWRASPSMCSAVLSTFLIRGSSSASSVSSGVRSRASWMLLASAGISFATLSIRAYSIPTARPTSFTACRLFMRPKVMIWDTRSLP